MSVYVYAITSATHPLRLDGLKGVGDPPGELRTVCTESLCAVISDAPEELRAKRRDVAAHQDVQQRLLEEDTALPMRFGLVGPDDDAVRAALEEHAERYTQRLGELAGRVEFNLKAAQAEEAALRDVLEPSDEVRRLNEITRAGGTHDDRLALGEMVAQQVEANQQALAGEIMEVLRPIAQAQVISPPLQDAFLNASFLVDKDRAQDFSEAGRKLAERYGEDFEFRLRGPLPPYSFV